MLNNIISIASVIFALTSVFISYYIYKASRTDTSYLDIDKQYVELLKIGLNEPDLRDYERTSMFYKFDNSDDFKRKYIIYSHMCWNLVETIYDRQKDKKGRYKLSETWIPVMFEENRLHYSWFKHNLRLFKPDFQKFVTGELNDIEIVEGNINDLKDVYSRLKKDFVANERKDYAHLEMLMIKKKYKLLLAKHKVFKEIIGYALIYEIEKKFLWLDFMAIDIKFQNAGYGTLLFNKIVESKQDGILGMFFEVEIPSEENEVCREEQTRRITFYERLGAKRLNFNYQLPTNNGGFPMYFYFKPSSNVKFLPKEQIKEAIASAFEYIHSDVAQKEAILKTFFSSIQDEYYK